MDSDAIGAGWRGKAAEEGPVCAEDEDEIYCTTYQDVEASGLIWEEISFEKTTDGTEICNTQLVDALKEKLVFDKEEWVALGVRDVTLVSYVQVGDKYFKPATAATVTASSTAEVLQSPNVSRSNVSLSAATYRWDVGADKWIKKSDEVHFEQDHADGAPLSPSAHQSASGPWLLESTRTLAAATPPPLPAADSPRSSSSSDSETFICAQAPAVAPKLCLPGMVGAAEGDVPAAARPKLRSQDRQSLKHLLREEAALPLPPLPQPPPAAATTKPLRALPLRRGPSSQRKSLADLKRHPSSSAAAGQHAHAVQKQQLPSIGMAGQQTPSRVKRQNSSLEREMIIDRTMSDMRREGEQHEAEHRRAEDQLQRRLQERKSRRRSKISGMQACISGMQAAEKKSDRPSSQTPAETHELHELNAIESMLAQMLQEHAQHEHHDTEELQELTMLQDALSFVKGRPGDSSG